MRDIKKFIEEYKGQQLNLVLYTSSGEFQYTNAIIGVESIKLIQNAINISKDLFIDKEIEDKRIELQKLIDKRDEKIKMG